MHVHTYGWYAYDETPLCAVRLPEPMSAEQKVALLGYLDNSYGDTDQETTDWALEYELWARYLLGQNAVPFNPRFLIVEDCMEEICAIMGDNENAAQFRKCVKHKAQLEQLVNAAFEDDPDRDADFTVDSSRWDDLKLID